MHEHQLDLVTMFCVVCGQRATDIEDRKVPKYCIDDTKNVVAVSHIISKRQMKDLLYGIPTAYKDNDSSTD